jgi:hypothetical protein
MTRRILIALAGCALLAGCGSSSTPKTGATTTITTTAANPTALLEQSVRSALVANARVSDYVLEHNAIPTYASESTSGPALAGMRGSAAQRKTGHITVRVLSDKVEVVSIELDPSFATATAQATERSSVVPYGKGRALGKPVHATEKARFVLHRVDSGSRFVVWSVASA